MANRAFLARWGLLLAAVALAVLFVGVTAWSDLGIRSRTPDLIRAEGERVLLRVKAQLEGSDHTLAQADGLGLALEADNTAESGVLWLALVDRDGRILAEAGDPGTLTEHPSEPGELVMGEGRARLMAPPPPPPRLDGASTGGGPGMHPPDGPRPGAAPGSGPPPRLLVDYRPTLAQDLQARTSRALGVAVLGALVLVGLALASWRARDRLEHAEREVARTQHLAALGQMSAVLAHELRNPLTALKGHAQLLVEGAEPGRGRRRAERVVRSAERLEGLTNDLLDFARTAELQRSPTPVMDPLHAALEGLAADRVEITDTVAGSHSLDGPRMCQVLANLIANALHYGPDDSRVEVHIGRTGTTLEYRVRDHGPGVPSEQRTQIFEPFVTGSQRGTGLGLAVARRICQLHGGTLTVTDADGGGACFVARIPEA